ncbi:MAG: VIT1/CCC1 transporter family protein, partial [Candidatus Omnitrophica bacterium]|nr:VIT1/CCC1 transporter family protein [Candidatus Omnitrophota bacterium]
MIDEDKLKYMGSVVLGLNDALVEFTGALAGFTFALQDSRLIGMVGLIMGFSASLSMAASEYLSTKTEADHKSPVKASIYTGIAYVMTVFVLVFPYFITANYYLSLGLTVVFAVLLILVFTFYYSVVKEIPFKARFIEMAAISLGVAALSFLIGLGVRKVLHVDI